MSVSHSRRNAVRLWIRLVVTTIVTVLFLTGLQGAQFASAADPVPPT